MTKDEFTPEDFEQGIKDRQKARDEEIAANVAAEKEKEELLKKYCRLNSRLTYPDAEDIYKEQGPEYIKKRIKKLEKRQAKPKKVVDKAALIKGIATAYYLNDNAEMLDRIIEDLKFLGFTDISCAAKKGDEDYVYEHIMIFSGRHTDPEVQKYFVEAPRTDVLFQYKFSYGQLLCIPFGTVGQKEASTNDIRKLHDLAYKIVSYGSDDHPSYLKRTYNYTTQEQGLRDFYHWTVIWSAENVKEEQERKAADELAARKRKAVSDAASKLDKAADLIRDYLIDAAAYKLHFGEVMPTITEKAVCWREAVPEVTLIAEGGDLPTLSVSWPKGQELPAEEPEEEEDAEPHTEE